MELHVEIGDREGKQTAGENLDAPHPTLPPLRYGMLRALPFRGERGSNVEARFETKNGRVMTHPY